MALSKRDPQLFLKRLRKAHIKAGVQAKIKYYLVGEYGGKTTRPHYHAIMFNARTELILPAWNKGEIHYGTVDGASIGYCLKYLSKTSKIPLHANDDRIPQFALMSKGLGANYLTPAMSDWHKADLKNRMYCNLSDGRKISMPRYYKDKLYTDQERKIVAAHQLNLIQIKQHEKEQNPLFELAKAEAVAAAFRRHQAKEEARDKL